VKRATEKDRREHARFPQAIDVRARTIPPVRASYPPSKEIQGRIQNVSQGGVCILSTQPLPISTFVFCDIAMPDIPVSIPTLMQVRWTAKRGREAHHYIHGLRFVAS
jgi:hypothetical protein